MKPNAEVLLDDRSLPAELRHDLDAYLQAQPQTVRLGAFIPDLHASTADVLSGTTLILTTVYVHIPGVVKETAKEIVKKWVTDWVAQKFALSSDEAKEYVTLFDAYGRPCVRVEKPSLRKPSGD